MCRHEDIAADATRRGEIDSAFAKWRELYDTLETLSV